MTTQVTFASPPTGAEAPAVDPAQVKATAPNDAPAADRPAWLPEQFKTAEDFAKSWGDQRAEITRAQQELAALKKAPEGTQPAADKKDDKTALEVPEGDKAVTDAVAKAGFDIAPFQKEWDEKGELTSDSIKKIAEGMKGVLGDQAEAAVQQWYESRKVLADNAKSQAENFTKSVQDFVGGNEAYGELMSWAKTNMNAGEKAAYNNAVNSGDINAARMAVDGLKARAAATGGITPDLLGGGNTDGNTGYGSSFEMTAAMRDPRYGKDPVYTKSVEQKVYRSNF